MNLHVIQFQYRLDFLRLVLLVCTILPRCHQMGFSSLLRKIRPTMNRIPEYHHFEEQFFQFGIILDGIVGSSDPEVLVDQVSDLSCAKETVLLLGLLFLQTDSCFEVRIMDDSVQCWSNLRMEYFTIWHLKSSYRVRRFKIIHWINHLHFFDPQNSFLRKFWTSTYLSLESSLPTNKRCWRGEVVEMKIWKSAVVVGLLHNSLKNPPSLGMTEFLADGLDWQSLILQLVFGFHSSHDSAQTEQPKHPTYHNQREHEQPSEEQSTYQAEHDRKEEQQLQEDNQG